MIHNRNQNTRFRSLTDCFYCIVVEEIKIFFNLLIYYEKKLFKKKNYLKFIVMHRADHSNQIEIVRQDPKLAAQRCFMA